MKLRPSERAQLRQFLEERFNLDELENLAFDLGVDYQCLTHTTLGALSRELVTYFERRDQLGCLVREALACRPDSNLAGLFASHLSEWFPEVRVQVILAEGLSEPNRLVELKNAIAQVLDVDLDEVAFLGAGWGGIRLQVTLSEQAFDSNISALSRTGVSIIQVPRVGRVHAGLPVPSVGRLNEHSYLTIPADLLPDHDNLFALRVDGDSMIDALVRDGDWVIIKPQATAQAGDMIMTSLIGGDEEITLKYYYPEGQQIRLQSSNPSYEPIFVPVDQLVIEGKVMLVIRGMP